MDSTAVEETQYSLGERLRRQREALGMGVEDLAREIRVSVRLVQALERGEYQALDAKVYAQGILRRMLRFFAVGDAEPFLAALDREWPSPGITDLGLATSINGLQNSPFSITPRRLGLTLGIVAAIGLVIFWLGRLITFSSPPRLIVTQPLSDDTVDRPVMKVSGQTEHESRLTVNGRELMLDEEGHFDEEIELQRGVNELEFIAENRFGKVSKQVRYILVE